MMDWKTAFRSFYYETADLPEDIKLNPVSTALLVIDIQNTYIVPDENSAEAIRWQPFYDRMNNTVIPNNAKLLEWARAAKIEVIFARIACQTEDGRDRSLSAVIFEKVFSLFTACGYFPTNNWLNLVDPYLKT